MYFYRRLGKISAITFDLDDTLYDNHSVIVLSEKKLLSFIQNYHPLLKTLKNKDIKKTRQIILEKEPEIYHHATEWRRRTIEKIMITAGLNIKEAKIGAKTAMIKFQKWRNHIHVAKETHDTLSKLVDKFPLIAITNGNAKPEKFGLRNYFQFVLRSGQHGRAKPFCDMYKLASELINISPSKILHVGDDLITDIAGALRFGMQACWIRTQNIDIKNKLNKIDANLLPHVEIFELKSLITLIN